MKKLLLTLGTVTSIATPVATVISCGDDPKYTEVPFSYSESFERDLEKEVNEDLEYVTEVLDDSFKSLSKKGVLAQTWLDSVDKPTSLFDIFASLNIEIEDFIEDNPYKHDKSEIFNDIIKSISAKDLSITVKDNDSGIASIKFPMISHKYPKLRREMKSEYSWDINVFQTKDEHQEAVDAKKIDDLTMKIGLDDDLRTHLWDKIFFPIKTTLTNKRLNQLFKEEFLDTDLVKNFFHPDKIDNIDFYVNKHNDIVAADLFWSANHEKQQSFYTLKSDIKKIFATAGVPDIYSLPELKDMTINKVAIRMSRGWEFYRRSDYKRTEKDPAFNGDPKNAMFFEVEITHGTATKNIWFVVYGFEDEIDYEEMA